MSIPPASFSTFNYATNGGFTCVALFALTSATQTSDGFLVQLNSAGTDAFRTFELYLATDGSIAGSFYYASQYRVDVTSEQLGTRSEWKLLIIRQNTTTNRLQAWLNNTLVATSSTTQTMANTAAAPNVNINLQNYTNSCSGARIGLLAVYDRSLTNAEITDIYDSVAPIIGTVSV
jgi:hypothetical protein